MLQDIIDAHDRLSSVVNQTPVFTSTTLDEVTARTVFIKAENMQKAGAFKMRGAYNTIVQLAEEAKARGIITHSSGNHAQAVAVSGQLLDIPTTIVMPENAPEVKVRATQGYGAKVVLCEPTMEAREETCNRLIEEHGYTLVHPYDNDHIIQGAATASKELYEQVEQQFNTTLDTVIGPVGGGGLMSGTGLWCKLSGKVKYTYAAEPFGADDAYRSVSSDNRVLSQVPNTIADGLRTTLSERTFGYISEYVDGIIRVSDEQILHAMRFLFERMKLVVEPSGAVPVASLLSAPDRIEGDTIGIIISGGNVDLSPLFNSYQ